MSDTPIDTLIIDIEAKATNADKAIDKFANAIGNLANSLARVDTGKLNSVGNGIQRLSSSLQTMKSIDTRSINSVVSKINSLSAIDTSQFATVSSNLHQMANGIQSLGTVSANVASVGELAKNIGKLGNKSVQTAVTNIPQLATALNGLMTTLSHAPTVSQNVIDMTNALANLSAQGSKVGSASNSIVKGLNKASTSATKAKGSFKGLASAFGKFYANCFLVIRGVKSLWNSINSTADYLEAFNYFEVALNKVGGDWASDWEKYSEKLGVTSAEEYANSFKTRLNENLKGLSGVQISVDADGKTGLLTDTGMKNLGLNIQEVTQYASQLASVTNSVGQTGEVTLATASAFTKLGADMSSLFNVDYSSVMNNLQSGLIGQSRALYKYGIDITNATLQTYAYELGVEKAVSEMTQAEKMQLRMIAILDQSRVSWGDQANTINSLSNSIRQFKNNISEAGQILGQLFVPILSKVTPIVNGLTIAIKRLMVSVAGLLGIKLDLSEFGQGTSGLEDDIDGITDAYDDATAAAKKFSTTTLGIDELNINSPQTDTSSGTTGSVGGGLDLTDSILAATSEYEAAWREAYDRMQNRAEEFANKIEKALEPVKKIFEDFAVGDFFQAGQDASKLAVSIFDFFAKAIDQVNWKKIGKKIGDFFAGIDWVDVLKSAGNLIWQGLKAAFEVAVGAFSSAPVETMVASLIAIPSLLKKITSNQYVSKLKDLATAFKKGGTAVSDFRDSLSTGTKITATTVTGVIEYATINDAVYNLKKGAENAVLEIAKIGTASVTAATVMYGALGPAGLAVAGIVGLVGAISGAKKAQEEMLQEFAEAQEVEVFGTTVDNLTGSWRETADAVRKNIDASREYVQDAGVAEMTMAQDLAKRYFTLAEKSSLTNEEKAKLNTYAKKLIEIFPELAKVYDEEAGKLDTTRDAVNNLIDAKLKEYQLAAIEEQITEAYRQQVDAALELEKANKAYSIAQEEMTQKQDAYNEAVGRLSAAAAYEEIGEAIRAGVTSLDDFGAKTDVLKQLNKAGVDSAQDLKEIYADLQDVLTKGGTEEIPTFRALGDAVDNAQLALEAFSESYHQTESEFFNLAKAEEDASTYIDELVEMLTNGGEEIADGAVVGYIDKIEADANKLKESGELIGDSSIEGTMEALNENSPSKVYAEIGAYAVEGFNIGVTKNIGNTINVMHAFVQQITGKFREVISPMHNIGVNVMQGLYNGLESMEGTLYAKAQSIADSIAETIRSALEIHSPSRVMAELGRYTIEGFKEGMENLYQPTIKSLQGFSYDVQVAPLEAPKLNYDYGCVPIQVSASSADYGNEFAADVKQAIKEVISEKLEPYLSDIVESGRAVADKDFSVAIGDKEIYKAALRGSRVAGRLLVT